MKPSAKLTINPEMLNRFKAYHEVHAAWGSLHIVLADRNLKDDSVEFCIKYAQEVRDLEGYELALILKQLSETQRAKIRNVT